MSRDVEIYPVVTWVMLFTFHFTDIIPLRLKKAYPSSLCVLFVASKAALCPWRACFKILFCETLLHLFQCIMVSKSLVAMIKCYLPCPSFHTVPLTLLIQLIKCRLPPPLGLWDLLSADAKCKIIMLTLPRIIRSLISTESPSILLIG